MYKKPFNFIIQISNIFSRERNFELKDKNNDGYVTLQEIRDFGVAVYKRRRLTPGEFQIQEWGLRNLYPKDLLGDDNKLDLEEFKAMVLTPKTTPIPVTTTVKPDKFSNKPLDYWNLNQDGVVSIEELFRFKFPELVARRASNAEAGLAITIDQLK